MKRKWQVQLACGGTACACAILLLTALVAPQVRAQTPAQAQAREAAGKAMMAKFAGSHDTDGLLKDPAVRAQLQKLVGPDLKQLERNLNVVGSVEVIGGALSVSGNAPHGGGSDEAVVCVAPNELMVQAAIASKGKITAYAADSNYDYLFQCVKDWITQFNSRHVDRMKQPKNVTVVKR